MEECIKKEYISFIQKQLAEMAKTVKKNSSKNQAKRENNIFSFFQTRMQKNIWGQEEVLTRSLVPDCKKSQCSFLEGNMVQNVCLILLFYIMLVLP